MAAILAQFSPAIRNAANMPALNADIDQVCDGVYQSQEEAQGALRGLGGRLVRNVSSPKVQGRIQGLFGKIVGAVPPVSLLELPDEIRRHVIGMLPEDCRIPLVCRQLYQDHRAVRLESILDLCRSNDPLLLFRAFEVSLSRWGNEVRNFERRVQEVWDVLSTEEREGLEGERTLDRIEQIFEKVCEILHLGPFQLNLGLEDEGEREQALRRLIGGGPKSPENRFPFLRSIRDRAEEVRAALFPEEQEGLEGEITFDLAVRIFRRGCDVSLIRLFEDIAEVEELSGTPENQARIIRDWLVEDGDSVTEILGGSKQLLCFPKELLLLYTPLRTLSLSDNDIRSLPQEIGYFHLLEELDISKNGLTSLANTVTKLASLTDLNASFNALTTVPSLDCLKNLAYVDLTFNELNPEKFDWEILSLGSLKQIDLEGNEGFGIPRAFIFDSETLQRIRNEELTVDLLPWYRVGEEYGEESVSDSEGSFDEADWGYGVDDSDSESSSSVGESSSEEEGDSCSDASVEQEDPMDPPFSDEEASFLGEGDRPL